MNRRNFFAFLGISAVAASETANQKLLATVASEAANKEPPSHTDTASHTAKAHPAPSVLIGNYHAMIPIGISFIWNHVAGVVVDLGAGKNWRQGICAPGC